MVEARGRTTSDLDIGEPNDESFRDRCQRGLVTVGMEIGSPGAFESPGKVLRRTGCRDSPR